MKKKIITLISIAAVATLSVGFIYMSKIASVTYTDPINTKTACGINIIFSENSATDDVTTTTEIVNTTLNITYPVTGFFNMLDVDVTNTRGELSNHGVFKILEKSENCSVLFDIYTTPLTTEETIEEYLKKLDTYPDSLGRITVNNHPYSIHGFSGSDMIFAQTIMDGYFVKATVLTQNIKLENPQEYLAAMLSRLNQE